MTEFLQLVVVGFSTGSAFALVGMSLVLVYRTTGIVNFAQGVFAVIGGLFTFQLSDDMPLALAMLVSILLAAFVSSILAVVAVGFRDRTTGLASTIITLGAAFLAQALLLLEFGDIPRSYPGISDTAWDVGGVLVQPQYVLIAGVALLSAVALTLFLRWTIVGQALVACSDSRRAAELVGLNLRSLAVVAFVGAGALCALGGALLAPSNPMTYSSDVAITVNGFAAAVFGGLGSIRLALLGGYALGILEQLVVGYVDPQYSLIIALIVMLVLIGWRSRAEIAHVSHDARAAIRRARVPWPAPVRIGLILAGAVFACWLPYQLSTFDVALYDRMGLYALVTIGLTLLMGYAGQISLGQGAFFLVGAYTSAILTVGIDPDSRFVDPGAGVSPILAVLAAPVVAAALAALIGVPLLRLHGTTSHSPRSRCTSSPSRSSPRGIASPAASTASPVTKPLTVFGHELRGPLHAAVVWAVVAIALLLATNLVRSRRGTRPAGDRHRRGVGRRVGDPGGELQAAAVRVRRRPRRARRRALHVLVPHRLPGGVSRRAEHPVRRDGRRGRPGNIYGAVAGTVAILYLEQKLRDLGTQPDCSAGPPDAAPTVFSFGVFGLILMAIMLFFPRPAPGDRRCDSRHLDRARRATPSAPAAGQRSP